MPLLQLARRGAILVCAVVFWATTAGASSAGEVRIAVAANFTAATARIAEAFETATGHTVIASFGSTGQLFAQIGQGAPYDVFLAADQVHPEKIRAMGLGAAAAPFTYAVGRIALWSPDPEMIRGGDTLQTGGFDRLAIANPETAPYGRAAIETLEALGLLQTLEPKLVRGNNIAQTFQFVATGNAEIGFVALSQITGNDAGSHWLVPENLHEPIRQDAVLLRHGADNEAALAFVEFLASAAAARIIGDFGYAAMSSGAE